MSTRTKSKAYIQAPNEIYTKWLATNRSSHALFITYTGIFVSLLMIFGDYLFIVYNTWSFTKIRIIGCALMCLNLFAIKVLLPRWQHRLSSQVLRGAYAASLCAAIFVYNIQYFYFSFALPHDKFSVYFTGLLLGVSFGAFLLHRFWREQFIFHSFFILFTLASVPFAKDEFREPLYIVIIVHLVSGFVAFNFRKDFLLNLNSRFNLVSAFIPKQLASHVVVSNSSEEVERIFKARNRYTVCLCCDWREYQKLVANYSADFISSMTEEYYNRVFEALDRIDPEGQYYANWTADELFVIFFDLKDDVASVDQRALEFTRELATKIFLQVRYDFSVDLKYDIGLASGDGYLGLQGPAKLKKTTITGFAAGASKRLETEAKTLRQADAVVNPNPIVLMDPHLYEVSQKLVSYKSMQFAKITALVKDIEGKTFYKFQGDYLDIKEVRKQKAG